MRLQTLKIFCLFLLTGTLLLTYATELIKNPETSAIYSLRFSGTSPQADFSGLVCLWQDIYSKHGEILSLIVMGTASTDEEET